MCRSEGHACRHLSQEVSNQDAEKKDRACNADEGDEGIERFFRQGVGRFPDGAEIDQEAEAGAQDKKEGLDHMYMIDKTWASVNPVTAPIL